MRSNRILGINLEANLEVNKGATCIVPLHIDTKASVRSSNSRSFEGNLEFYELKLKSRIAPYKINVFQSLPEAVVQT